MVERLRELETQTDINKDQVSDKTEILKNRVLNFKVMGKNTF